MPTSSPRLDRPGGGRPVSVVGAGVCGGWAALLLAEAGFAVTAYEADAPDGARAAGWWAGGMLAPDCESDGAEPIVVRLGRRSLDLWRDRLPEATAVEGSLAVAHGRDRAELERFARRTTGWRRLDAEGVAALEPALAGRFATGLFFPNEGHVEPRRAVPAVRAAAEAAGARFRFGAPADPSALAGDVVDCRGLAARADRFPDLRGVKGETALLETDEVALRRPVRLLHPRWPLYVVPRAGGRFLVGASTIESEDARGVSVRSALELLTAAFTVHPAFGEARIVELGTALRPAFPDHAPRIDVRGASVAVNGLYRHGFLLAPALAETLTAWLAAGVRDNEVMRWS